MKIIRLVLLSTITLISFDAVCGKNVQLSHDNKFLVTGLNDGTAKVTDAKTSQLIYTLAGHSQPVNVVAISPDNQYIATGSDDGTVKVWDANTGQLLFNLTSHSKPVTTIEISPLSKIITTGSDDGIENISDLKSGLFIRTLPIQEPISDYQLFKPFKRDYKRSFSDYPYKAYKCDFIGCNYASADPNSLKFHKKQHIENKK